MYLGILKSDLPDQWNALVRRPGQHEVVVNQISCVRDVAVVRLQNRAKFIQSCQDAEISWYLILARSNTYICRSEYDFVSSYSFRG